MAGCERIPPPLLQTLYTQRVRAGSRVEAVGAIMRTAVGRRIAAATIPPTAAATLGFDLVGLYDHWQFYHFTIGERYRKREVREAGARSEDAAN